MSNLPRKEPPKQGGYKKYLRKKFSVDRNTQNYLRMYRVYSELWIIYMHLGISFSSCHRETDLETFVNV